MKTAVIFGAGGTGRRIYAECSKTYSITCYIDSNYQNKMGGGKWVARIGSLCGVGRRKF